MQRYRRSVLTRSLQYPNVHTPGKISRCVSSAVVAPVPFPSVDIHIINQNSGDSLAHPLHEESCGDPTMGGMSRAWAIGASLVNLRSRLELPMTRSSRLLARWGSHRGFLRQVTQHKSQGRPRRVPSSWVGVGDDLKIGGETRR